jgi:molecular chaperone HscC
MIARMFGRLPAQTINPDEVVARGAAVQAGLKMRDAALEEVVMTDVAPFSLGIETSRLDANEVRQFGLFAPILERNTVIPASRVQRFFTIRDGQTKIDVEIFQGEARKVIDNIKLGKMSVAVPRAAAGHESIDVRFTYDVSGMLEVDVTVTSTGEMLSTMIEGSAQALSVTEIEARRQRLAALKVHPREQAENRAALARAERLFEESLGAVRARIGEWVDDFTAALDSQENKRIDQARRALVQRLAEIDRDPFDA